MQTAILPLELLNEVLQVLAQRPYAEVAPVIQKIQQGVTVEGEPDQPEETPDGE